MIRSSDHVEMRFLMKCFASYYNEANAIIHFREMYGKDPTRYQLANADLGRFLTDKRKYFQNNHRVKLFRKYREDFEASSDCLPLASKAWRMQQYQLLYDRSLLKARETGNTTRCSDILVLAAKEEACFYEPKSQHVTIDNRVQNMNLSDEEINKRLQVLLNQFNIRLPDMPLIEKGATVIEYEADDSEQQG